MDNQNTLGAALKDYTKIDVLILVLVDNQNTSVLVDNEIVDEVLILVLVDNQNTYEYESTNVRTIRLNPCFSG